MKNPAWQDAEDERLEAEAAYTKWRKDPATLLLREDNRDEWERQARAHNEAIEAANRAVRITPEEIDED